MTTIQDTSKLQVGRTVGLVIDAAPWFEDEAFLNWLNDKSNPVMTWHTQGEPVEDYSDVVVHVSAALDGEGPDSEMPSHIWNAIVGLCRDNFAPNPSGHLISVRLTPMEA